MLLPSIQRPCVHPRLEINPFENNSLVPYSFEAMGCRFEILIGTQSISLCDTECVAACEEIRDLVLDWHTQLSVFDPNSTVSSINQSTCRVETPLNDDLFELLSVCEQFRAQTDGAFNIAAGTLMHAHGFREQIIDNLDGLTIDHPFVLDAQRKTIQKTDDRIKLDFGAVAKGFVLDLIELELQELGITDAFIHGGTSSVLAIGQDTNSTPWASSVGSGVTLSLTDMSIGVSEVGSQVRTQNTMNIGHVMDPRTMQDARNSITRVVCVHRSAARADAYSTACSVNPDLMARLAADPCTLIAFEEDTIRTMHDPLGAVLSSPEDHHDRN